MLRILTFIQLKFIEIFHVTVKPMTFQELVLFFCQVIDFYCTVFSAKHTQNTHKTTRTHFIKGSILNFINNLERARTTADVTINDKMPPPSRDSQSHHLNVTW